MRHELELVCDAAEIPDEVVIDLAGTDIGDSIHISQVTLPQGTKSAITDRDFTIATIVAPSGIKSEAAEAAAAAEGVDELAPDEVPLVGEDEPRAKKPKGRGLRSCCAGSAPSSVRNRSRCRASRTMREAIEDWGEFEPVQIWVGLGNPGAQYAMHRHNVGFMAVDAIAEVHGFDPAEEGLPRLDPPGPDRRPAHPDAQARHLHERLRPSRRRGDALLQEDAGDVTVFHDELDLAPFKVKVKVGGGTAGHNGIRSLDAHIGNAFRRVRIGIGHPGHKDRVTRHVLGNYAKAEIDPLGDLLAAIAAEAEWLAKGDDARFMNDVALRLQQES